MELDLSKINSALENENNNINKALIYRLTFKLIRAEYKADKFSINLLKKQIFNMRSKYLFAIKDAIIGDELKYEVNEHYKRLSEMVNKIDIENKNDIFNIKLEVTYLECLLDIELSYIETAYTLLNELINKKTLNR